MTNIKNIEDSNYVHSLKTRILKIILLLCSILIPILAFLEFLDGDIINFTVEIIFELPIIISFILLLRGKYRGSSNLLVIVAFLMMSLLSMIVKPTGPILFYRNVTYHLVAISLSILFVNDFKITLCGAGVMILVQIVFGFFFLIPAGFEKGSVISMMIMAICMYSLIVFLLLEHTLIAIKQSKQLDNSQRSSQTQLSQIQEIVQSASENLTSVSNLSSKVDQIQNLVTDTISSMSDINTVADKIDSNAITSKFATDTIGNSISKLTDRISELVASQEQSDKSIKTMLNTANSVANATDKERKELKSLSETSNQGKAKLNLLLQNINQVDASIKSVNKMIEVIQKIANQTNLLAMNAAIEASHAGEAGKGFAVVASQIRSLADSSAKNSTEISQLLETISGYVEEVSVQSSETSAAFKQIEENINSSVKTIEDITNASSELLENGEQVISVLNNVEECSNGINNDGKQISNAHNDLIQTQNTLQQSIQLLNNATKIIDEKNASVINALKEISEVSNSSRAQAEEFERIAQLNNNN